MATVIGRVREDALLHLRLVAMSHNVVRGAAGGSVLNAELLLARGVIHHESGALQTSGLSERAFAPRAAAPTAIASRGTSA
jgi:aspartate-semialdehyde dehydrogenase